ncbi:NUDIX domain-containing protein [Amycolatopsis aidingensis]|uniref:NUDIX domain-containing protein n=1 Tax=Amycolatopsis aidingensis TaxID=2842453 RepID=UPI001C0D00AE|nr:NUDIX domain-containing protein [Amycolatopsis aidingensis]
MPLGGDEGEPATGPWVRRAGRILAAAPPWATLHLDSVLRPDGSPGEYAWVEAPDVVRVLLLLPGRMAVVVRQWHYLTGPAWQLPGGTVDPGLDGEASGARAHAAARELAEETGIRAERLIPLASWEPAPGLTPMRVHVYLGSGVAGTGTARPEPGEADLEVHRVPLAELVAATMDGRLRCAASAAAVHAAHGGHLPPGSRLPDAGGP